MHVQGTINGFGERVGNANLVSIIPNLMLKLGYTCMQPDSLPQLKAVAQFVYEMANVRPNTKQAFVGDSAFAHKAGMHVDGVRKLASSFEHINPESGRQPAPHPDLRAVRGQQRLPEGGGDGAGSGQEFTRGEADPARAGGDGETRLRLRGRGGLVQAAHPEGAQEAQAVLRPCTATASSWRSAAKASSIWRRPR
jgi:hypothetical protein